MSKKNSVFPAFLVMALLAAAAWYYYHNKIYLPKKAESERAGMAAAASAAEFLEKSILIEPLLLISADGQRHEYMARMPLRWNAAGIRKAFNDFCSGKKGVTAEVSEVSAEKASSVSVTLRYEGAIVAKIRLARNNRPKIAVILDDWGYNKKGFHYLASIKYPFTAAVLPGLTYSRQAAYEANRNRKAVMLHLPMQPEKDLPREKNMILSNMSKNEINFVIGKLTGEIPFFTGVNNHQGSLATSDSRVMGLVMAELKKRNLFFVDSLTTSRSVAFEQARLAGVPAAERVVFIDNEKDINYNELQLEQVKKAARKNGFAVAIGHDDVTTLKALEIYMPLIEAEGFEFVYAAEVVR
ncbi:MAG TPA: divergent polysaccharide deacetylase family protein [Candidatus Goldiibacteriota bacterium]|nr:divergent polysaccharide deacetylase family protein [Candidatus Goldiibacteriota bacterium]